MAFLHLNFDNFEFRDLGHSDFLSFKVLAPTHFQPIEKIPSTSVDNLDLQITFKFQAYRIKIVRVLLLAESKNAILRTTRLKFAFLPTYTLRRSTRKAVTVKIKYF